MRKGVSVENRGRVFGTLDALNDLHRPKIFRVLFRNQITIVIWTHIQNQGYSKNDIHTYNIALAVLKLHLFHPYVAKCN
jgi:hypothetical protein